MKTKLFTFLLGILASSSTLWAFDAKVYVGGIYYYLDNSTYTAEVTCRGDTGSATVYPDDYSGALSIPSSITYNNTNYQVSAIGTRAFVLSHLTSVSIPNSVTIIKDKAFSQCSMLNFVTIGNSVTHIGTRAFEDCTDLYSINIPNSVTNIGASAFIRCINLPSITIPNSVTYIGPQAFSRCSSLASISLPYNNSIELGPSLFYQCTSLPVINGLRYADTYLVEAVDTTLSTITIEDGTRWIGSSAFSKCKHLNNIIIPQSVTDIQQAAFQGCDSLTYMIIPNSVIHIGNYVFTNCSQAIICVPVSTICGSNPFSNCRKVIRYTDNIDSYWFNESILTGYTGIDTKLQLPVNHNGETYTIGYASFSNLWTEIDSVSIPNAVTSIGVYAFKDCQALRHVILPGNLSQIATDAFLNCDSIISLTIGMHPETPSLKTLFKKNINKTLRHFTLAEGSTIMGTDQTGNNYLVFANDTVLESVSIPYTVQTIAPQSFMNCRNLQSIRLGYLPATSSESNQVQHRRHNGFGHLDPQGNFDAYSMVIAAEAFLNDESAEYISWGSTTKKIEERAFKGCKKLLECELPNTLEEIGMEAFAECSALQKVVIPASVTTTGLYTFRNDISLTDLTINCNIKVFSDNNMTNRCNFAGCNHLRTIRLKSYVEKSTVEINSMQHFFNWSSESVEELEFLPGSNCIKWSDVVNGGSTENLMELPNLKSLKMADGITLIDVGAFKGSYLLEKVTFPESLRTFGNRCFMDCGFKTITLPPFVEKIGNGSFSGCTNVKSLYTDAPIPPVCGTGVFDGIKRDYTLHCLTNSVDDYRNAPIWSTFFENNLVYSYTIQYVSASQIEEPEVVGTPNGVVISCTEEEGAHSCSMNIRAEDGNDNDIHSFSFEYSSNAEMSAEKPILRMAATSLVNVIRFSMEGLQPETAYLYTIKVLDAEGNVLNEYNGRFITTDNEQGIEFISNDVNNVSDVSSKILHDGVMYIQRGPKTYTLQGQEVR